MGYSRADGCSLQTAGRARMGNLGPVHYIRDRLAFMKAEFEISNAQEQLWEAFAEALRDFLKARSRPDIGGPGEQPGCRNGWRCENGI